MPDHSRRSTTRVGLGSRFWIDIRSQRLEASFLHAVGDRQTQTVCSRGLRSLRETASLRGAINVAAQDTPGLQREGGHPTLGP
jgi:hypothetical protein